MFAVVSSPSHVARLWGFSLLADSFCYCDDALGFLTRASSVVVKCQPWFYLKLVAYSFFWLSEGAYG